MNDPKFQTRGARTIYDIGEENGRAFIGMELLEGRTLKHQIGGKPLEVEELLGLGAQVVKRAGYSAIAIASWATFAVRA